MKSLWNSFKASFAMFSKIPMPMVDWKKENIKYMMCFFPFVGTAIGILTWLAGGILGVHAALEPFRWSSGYFGCIKLLAGTHKEAGDPEGFPCRCICHYHSLCIFYPLAGSLGSAPWKL